MPKYLATVQKPWSLTCEAKMKVSESARATPPALRTAPRTPPAPTTSRMLPTGFSEAVDTVSKDVRGQPRRIPSR
jgi:hypothetical protein